MILVLPYFVLSYKVDRLARYSIYDTASLYTYTYVYQSVSSSSILVRTSETYFCTSVEVRRVHVLPEVRVQKYLHINTLTSYLRSVRATYGIMYGQATKQLLLVPPTSTTPGSTFVFGARARRCLRNLKNTQMRRQCYCSLTCRHAHAHSHTLLHTHTYTAVAFETEYGLHAA